MNLFTGTHLGRYQVVEQLGQGGMAVVLKAYDQELERTVAIKVILQNEMHSPEFLARFKREARTLARLSHPNIVKILDYGEQNGAPYLVMEYIQDGNLANGVERPMNWQAAARLLIPVGKALEGAHRQGIIHRDVKPANILLSESGEALLSDFGISKMIEMHETAELTAPGMGIGTPEYMAPEQSLGKEIDFRADIYSLGVVFYELITGVRPFTADTPLGVLLKHHNSPLPPPSQYIPNLPIDVERTIYKLMAKDPDQRFSTMDEAVGALENIAHGIPVDIPDSAVQTVMLASTQMFDNETLDQAAAGEVQPAPNGRLPQAGPANTPPPSRAPEVGLGWQPPPFEEGQYDESKPWQRKITLIALLGGLALLGIIAAAVMFGARLFAPKIITVTGGQISTPPVEFASVSGVSGRVEIVSNDGSALRLSDGMRLLVGGPFRLRSIDGTAQLALVGGTAMCVQPGTDIEFINITGGANGSPGLSMSLLAGKLLVIDGEQNNSLFSITGPIPVNIGSQGAIIGLEASPGGMGRLDLDCLFGACTFDSPPGSLALINPGHTWLVAAGLFNHIEAARTDLWASLCADLTSGRISSQPTETTGGLLGFFNRTGTTRTPTVTPTRTASPSPSPTRRIAIPLPVISEDDDDDDRPRPTRTLTRVPPTATAFPPTPTRWPTHTPTQALPSSTPTSQPTNLPTATWLAEPTATLGYTDTPGPTIIENTPIPVITNTSPPLPEPTSEPSPVNTNPPPPAPTSEPPPISTSENPPPDKTSVPTAEPGP